MRSRAVPLRSCEEIVVIGFLRDRCAAPSALGLWAAQTPRSRAGLLLCRLFEAGLQVIDDPVLRPAGQQTRREAPAGGSHARKRVVSRDKQNRGLKGRYIDAERFLRLWPFSIPASRPGLLTAASSRLVWKSLPILCFDRLGKKPGAKRRKYVATRVSAWFRETNRIEA